MNNLYEKLKSDHRFLNEGYDGTDNSHQHALRSYRLFYLGLLEKQRALQEEINHQDEFEKS